MSRRAARPSSARRSRFTWPVLDVSLCLGGREAYFAVGPLRQAIIVSVLVGFGLMAFGDDRLGRLGVPPAPIASLSALVVAEPEPEAEPTQEIMEERAATQMRYEALLARERRDIVDLRRRIAAVSRQRNEALDRADELADDVRALQSALSDGRAERRALSEEAERLRRDLAEVLRAAEAGSTRDAPAPRRLDPRGVTLSTASLAQPLLSDDLRSSDVARAIAPAGLAVSSVGAGVPFATDAPAHRSVPRPGAPAAPEAVNPLRDAGFGTEASSLPATEEPVPAAVTSVPRPAPRREEAPVIAELEEPAPSLGKPYLQAGVFTATAYGYRLHERLVDAGIVAEVLDTTFLGRPAVRVRVGPLQDADARRIALAELRRLGIDDAIPITR